MIPFLLVPEPSLKPLVKNLLPLSTRISNLFPFLKENLFQADMHFRPVEYIALSLAGAITNGAFFLVLLMAVGLIARTDLFAISIALGLAMSLFSFFTILFYPSLTATGRAREIDRYLIYAVRHIVIQLRSGVPLYNALAAVTVDYGEASKEFRKIVSSINSGASELDVISDAAGHSPSLHFRRVFWQAANSLKVGADVSLGLVSQLDDLTKDRIEQIKRFGQELSSWSVFYMLGAIIFPSLGVTVLIVLTSFLGVQLPSLIFGVILAVLVIFQLFFMNLIASRRPFV